MIALALATLVDATTIVPHLRLDVRYATAGNFTHQRLYAHARCLLHDAVARRLADVQRDLGARGLKAAAGGAMLVHQGARALELWTGKQPPVDVMRKALDAAL